MLKARFASAKKPKAAAKKPARQKPAHGSSRSGGLAERITAAGDRLAFSWAVRERFYRHMSAQIGNGITVEAALDSFRARLVRRKRVSSEKIIADVARRMRDGSTLASALAVWIPQDESGVIASGELSGNLPRSFDLLVEAKRKILRVNNAVKMAMITPAIYLIAVAAVLWAIGAYVTPGLESALPRARASGLVYGLYVASDFANSWLAILPPIFVLILVIAVIRSMSKWTGRSRVFVEQVFPYSFYRDIQGYTWLMSFAALLRAGMPDVEILKRQAALAGPWLRERLYSIWWRMDNGSSLPAALLAKGKGGMPAFGFPNPDIVDDIASLAGFSDFAERISKLAMLWADDLETQTIARAKSYGFAIEIAMYVIMGLLMIAINSMSTQLGNVGGVPGM